MVDLREQMGSLWKQLAPELQEILLSGQFVRGPQLEAFEEEVATHLGVAHAIGVASGTDALHLALRATEIGTGDEVITTPFTFAGTAEAICHTGAHPRFVDIDPATYNLDPNRVEEAITPRTRAILPVHLFGQPVDMAGLGAIATDYGLEIIEDCAHSFGARRNHWATGAWGRAGAFSFFPTKNLGGAGDGGLITTHDTTLATRLQRMRNHGSNRSSIIHEERGFNSRLDEIQAVILRAKLRHIRAYNEGRRRVAAAYRRYLASTPVTLPEEVIEGSHVYHQFVIQVGNRDEVQAALQAEGIASAAYYTVPLHHQPAFAEFGQGGACPVTERIAQHALALPIYPELDKERVEQVASVVAQTARP